MTSERFVREAIRPVVAMAALLALLLASGCSMMGKSTPKGGTVTVQMTATRNLNKCGKSVPQRLYYRVIQVTDATPLSGMKLENIWDREGEMLGGAFVTRGLDLSIEPGASRTDAPVTIDPRAKAVVVIGNFCMTRGSCYFYSLPLAEKRKKNLELDLTADSTCIGPTPH